MQVGNDVGAPPHVALAGARPARRRRRDYWARAAERLEPLLDAENLRLPDAARRRPMKHPRRLSAIPKRPFPA